MAAFGAGLVGGGQENFQLSVGDDHRTDVPPVHNQALLFGHLLLQPQQKGAHAGDGGDVRGGHGGFRAADGFRHILPV